MSETDESFSEQRAAPRSSLMLRTAKVVCQSGEYVCLVRDVSAAGVGLRYFHPLPPEQRIFLELANGRIYPVERVWARKAEAGYRFASPIDLSEFVSEASDHPHRAIRLRLNRPALVTVDGRDFQARLVDVSRTGAKLETEANWPLSAFARLEVAGLPLRFGTVQWRHGGHHGIVFQGSIPLEDLALSLYTMQPYIAPQPQPTRSWEVRAA